MGNQWRQAAGSQRSGSSGLGQCTQHRLHQRVGCTCTLGCCRAGWRGLSRGCWLERLQVEAAAQFLLGRSFTCGQGGEEVVKAVKHLASAQGRSTRCFRAAQGAHRSHCSWCIGRATHLSTAGSNGAAHPLPTAANLCTHCCNPTHLNTVGAGDDADVDHVQEEAVVHHALEGQNGLGGCRNKAEKGKIEGEVIRGCGPPRPPAPGWPWRLQK